ncbi:hypothetical protein KY285_020466 [Solanum tuberosum]|nr:hypothetical protein KY285_020466 [Solanum tuberosum]
MAENIIIDKVVGESGASNSNAIGQSQTVESQVNKGRKKRSHAWDHFFRKIDFDGSEKGVCNYRKKEYFADTKEHGTMSMLTHIAKCPKMPYNIDIKQSRLAFQPMIGGNKGDVVVVPWTVKCIHCCRVTYYHSHNTGTTSLKRHVKRCLENRNQNHQLSRIDD